MLKVDHNKEMMDILVNRLTATAQVPEADTKYLSLKSSLPLKTMPEFLQLEEKVKEGELKQFLVSETTVDRLVQLILCIHSKY